MMKIERKSLKSSLRGELLMQKQSLADLLKALEQEQSRLHYTRGTMQFYRRRWKMLMEFAEER